MTRIAQSIIAQQGYCQNWKYINQDLRKIERDFYETFECVGALELGIVCKSKCLVEVETRSLRDICEMVLERELDKNEDTRWKLGG